MKKRLRTEEEIVRHYRRKRRIIIGISVFLLILLYAFKNASFLIRTTSTIALLFLFYAVDHLFDVKFKEKHYIFIISIAIFGMMLSPLYYLYQSYDKILHFALPLMFASIIFHMAKDLDIRMRWKLTFVFFVVCGFVGLHELGEYWLDYFFDLKLQGVFLRDLQSLEKYNILMDRIDDTMYDMSYGVLGAAVYCLSLGAYYKYIHRTKRTR